MNKYLLTLLFIALTGCATDLQNIKSTDGMATIVAYSDSAGNILLPISSTKRTRIEEVDRKKVSDAWNNTDQINIEPGLHNIIISCHIIQGGINVSNKTNHELTVVEGNIYIFKAYLDSNHGCTTKYEHDEI